MEDRTLKLEIWSSLRQIAFDDWESLAGGDVKSSYGWLRTVEETHSRETATAYYLVKANGTPLGAAVSYFTRNPRKDQNLNNIFFGRMTPWAQRLGLSFIPALECYPFRAYGQHFFLAPHLESPTRRKVMQALLEGIEAEARRYEASPCFLHVLTSESELWQLLSQRGYRKTLDYPLAYIDIEWPDFKGYKNYIKNRSRNMMRNIAKEINRNRRQKVSIEDLVTVEDEGDRLWELLNLNFQKYNPGEFPFKRNFFQRLKANLGDEAVVSVARKNGCLTGVSLTLKRGAVGYTPMVGVDHALAGPDATYFMLGFYHPVQLAIEQGLRRVYFGNAKYKLKQRRGCKISNCFIFYKSFKPVTNSLVGLWFEFHRRWYHRKHREYDIQPFSPPCRPDGSS